MSVEISVKDVPELRDHLLFAAYSWMMNGWVGGRLDGG